MPARVVRRRMLARANEQLVREFDKHAGGRVGTWRNASTAYADGSKPR